MTAAGGVLATSVTLRDSKFQLVTFAVGSTPPAWAQARITNPKAWATAPEVEDPADDEPADDVTDPEEDLIGDPEPSSPAPEAPVGGTGEPARLPKPAQGGAGSGRALWVAYADQEGVDFPEDATRDQIADAVEAAERSK